MRKLSSIIAVVLVICMLASCTGPVNPNVEVTTGNDAEVTTSAPTTTTEAPADNTTEAPAIETTEAPVIETTEAPATEKTEAPVVETTEEPVIETTEAPAVETTEVPATETTEAPATETTEEPATETTEEPEVETTEEVTDKVVENDPSNYPALPPSDDKEDETTDNDNAGSNIPGGIVPGWRPEEQKCNHEYVYQGAELLVPGASCSDGVVATFECGLCGDIYEQTYHNSHFNAGETAIIVDYDVCEKHDISTYECLCGAYKEFILLYSSYSEYTDPEDEDCDLLRVYDMCPDCGVSATLKMDLMEIDGCIYAYTADITIEIYGEPVHNFESDISTPNHSYLPVSAELVEGAESCLDGVSVRYECKNCGEVSSGYRYDHYKIAEYIDVSGFDVCDTHTPYVAACACGEVSEVFAFDVNITEVDGDTFMYCDTCDFTVLIEEDGEGAEGCEYEATFKVTVSCKDEDIYTGYYTSAVNKHNYEKVGVELAKGAETCFDGVIVTFACTECGGEKTERWTGHVEIEEKLDLSEFDHCGGHQITISSCACGETQEVIIAGGYGAGWNEELQKWVSTCKNCDFFMYYVIDYGEKDEECWGYVTTTFEFYFGETYLGTYVDVDYTTMHATEQSYEFLTDSEKCTDGVTITYTCKDCGETVYSRTVYTHEVAIMDEVDFSAFCSEYGVCESHKITLTGCACGVIKNHFNENISTSYVNWDEEKGMSYAGCDDCGLRIYVYDDDGQGFYDEENHVTIRYSRYECYVYADELIKIAEYYSTHQVYDQE